MRAGGRILMIFGFLLALIAGLATFLIIQRAGAAPEGTGEGVLPPETVQVVVAFQTIEPWQEIPADAIQIREYPSPAPTDAVLAEKEIADETGAVQPVSGMEYVRGKISNTRIYPGQVIVETQLVDKALEEQRLGLGGDVSYIVPEGQVATTLPLNDASSISGGLRAGDQVDIIATINLTNPDAPDEQGNSVVQFLMQRVQILRVGPWVQQSEDEQQAGSTVTVIVDPQQALELKAIREFTSFEFVLRSITDESNFVTEPVDLDYLIEQYNVQP